MRDDDPIKAVELMRSLRDGINRDVQDMTPEQRVEYIRLRATRVARELSLPEAVAPVARRQAAR